jgi:hypothetical protein
MINESDELKNGWKSQSDNPHLPNDSETSHTEQLGSEQTEGSSAGADESKTVRSKFGRRTDVAQVFESKKRQFLETFINPLIMEESVLHPNGQEVNPSKLYMVVGGGAICVLAVAAGAFLSLPRANRQQQLAAASQAASPQQVVQPRPQPQFPPQPQPQQVPRVPVVQQPYPVQRGAGTAQPPVRPQPQPRAVLSAGVSKNQGMSAEQRKQKSHGEALQRVQLRASNLNEPLTGSGTARGAQIASQPGNTNATVLPPPQVIQQLQSNRGAAVGSLPLPAPISLVRPRNNPYSLYGSRTVAQSLGQGQSPIPYGQQNPYGQNQQGGGYQQGGNPYGQPQASYPGQQNPYNSYPQNQGQQNPYSQAPISQGAQFSTGVQQTIQTPWTLIPPGVMLKAVSRSMIQVAKTGGSINTPVFAQVKGAIRVDGQEVIPDGAILNGRVVNVDEALGRIRIEFTSLSIGATSIPLKGAMAWTMSGASAETATISEGLEADQGGLPNYFATDARAGIGQGAQSIAQTLGQTTTTTNGVIGTSSTSSYSGDTTAAVQRGLSQGLSTFLGRQVTRADKATSKQESRGPIWTVQPMTEFVIFLSQGI